MEGAAAVESLEDSKHPMPSSQVRFSLSPEPSGPIIRVQLLVALSRPMAAASRSGPAISPRMRRRRCTRERSWFPSSPTANFPVQPKPSMPQSAGPSPM